MMKKQWIVGSVLTAAFLLTGCAEASSTTKEAEYATAEQIISENAEPEMVTITDSAGHEVEVPFNPETIAVFDNGQLDNLNALGLGDRVVLTASPNLPEHLSGFSEREVAGSFFEIDLEVTNAMQPDLIIVAGRSRTAYDDLAMIAPTIDLSNDTAHYYESIDTNLNRLATIFGKEEQAETLLTELEEKMTTLKEEAQASELTTLMTLFNEGSLSAYGPGSRFGVIHDAFGFTPIDDSIEVSNHGMEVSFEYVLEKDPDVLFILDRTAAIGGDVTSETLNDNPLIQETKAYSTDDIYYLSPSAWYLSEGGVETFHIMMDEVKEALSTTD